LLRKSAKLKLLRKLYESLPSVFIHRLSRFSSFDFARNQLFSKRPVLVLAIAYLELAFLSAVRNVAISDMPQTAAYRTVNCSVIQPSGI